MTVGSMYGFNPYMMTNTGYGADFMASATGYDNQYAQLLQQQALAQQLALQQPTTDVYQTSNGGSGLGSGAKCAVVGGIGAGAGAYFFGDKLGASLTKDGKTFSDDILKAFQGDPVELAKTIELNEVAAQKNAILTNNGFANAKEYEAIKKYVSTPAADRGALAKETTDLVPDAVKNNPTSYEAKLFRTRTAIDNIDVDAIGKQALKDAQAGNLACQQEELANLVKRKSLLEGLPKDANLTQIEEIITKNPKAFGIEKTVEAEIQAEAKAIAQRYATKAGALAEVTPLVTASENSVKNLRTSLNGQVATHWDDAAKAFRADAPETLTKAAKNFKWAKAGKYAAIAAGVGLVLGWMFGGNKS